MTGIAPDPARMRDATPGSVAHPGIAVQRGYIALPRVDAAA